MIMKIEETPFCRTTGLLNFSKVLAETIQTLRVVYNFEIKDNAEEDKLEFWGTERGIKESVFCYGRHLFLKDRHFWIGLDIAPVQITVSIQFFQNEKPVNTGELLKPNKENCYSVANDRVVMNGDNFKRFYETLSCQILTNFTAEVLKALK